METLQSVLLPILLTNQDQPQYVLIVVLNSAVCMSIGGQSKHDIFALPLRFWLGILVPCLSRETMGISITISGPGSVFDYEVV